LSSQVSRSFSEAGSDHLPHQTDDPPTIGGASAANDSGGIMRYRWGGFAPNRGTLTGHMDLRSGVVLAHVTCCTCNPALEVPCVRAALPSVRSRSYVQCQQCQPPGQESLIPPAKPDFILCNVSHSAEATVWRRKGTVIKIENGPWKISVKQSQSRLST
jgi:hypothetical protein